MITHIEGVCDSCGNTRSIVVVIWLWGRDFEFCCVECANYWFKANS